MKLHPSLYPIVGIAYLFKEPQLIAKMIFEILMPVFWVSERLLNAHHRSVFNDVLTRQLGPTRPILHLTEPEKAQLKGLVTR